MKLCSKLLNILQNQYQLEQEAQSLMSLDVRVKERLRETFVADAIHDDEQLYSTSVKVVETTPTTSTNLATVINASPSSVRILKIAALK